MWCSQSGSVCSLGWPSARAIAKIMNPMGRMSNRSPHPALSPHRMRGEGGFSRVRGVPAHDVDRKLLLATTLDSTLINLVKLSRRLLTTDSTDFIDRNKSDPCHPRNPWLNF